LNNPDVDFNSEELEIEGTSISGTIPNLALSSGESETVFYAVCALDSDAPEESEDKVICSPDQLFHSFLAYSPDDAECIDDGQSNGSQESASQFSESDWRHFRGCGGSTDVHTFEARPEEKATAFDHLIKIGRTHLMDATPIRLGQVFSGYAQQAFHAKNLVQQARQYLEIAMPIGGTAVGTGINTHPEFGQRVCDALAERTGIPFKEAMNHPEAQAAKNTFVLCHGHLKTIAVSLSKIANDIRHLGSGPRAGLFELMLPAIQPGSSIMPGKVNPVICESVMQVASRVSANDQAITLGDFGGVGSIFELNVAMPMIVDATMESIELLSNTSNVMVDKLLTGLEVNEKQCRALIERSLMMVTSLAPEIGYDNAARLAKQAFEEDRNIRELVREQGLLGDDKLEELLEPRGMTEPSG